MTSVGFNWADGVILAVILLSALISLFRGFVREALSLVAWILAFWLAFVFCHPASNYLSNYIESPTMRIIAAFAGIFFITLIVCSIINFLIGKVVDGTGLSGTDRMLGVIFGLARGVILIAALLLVTHLTPMPEEKWWSGSLLIPRFEPLELWLQSYLPESMVDKFQLTSKD